MRLEQPPEAQHVGSRRVAVTTKDIGGQPSEGADNAIDSGSESPATDLLATLGPT